MRLKTQCSKEPASIDASYSKVASLKHFPNEGRSNKLQQNIIRQHELFKKVPKHTFCIRLQTMLTSTCCHSYQTVACVLQPSGPRDASGHLAGSGSKCLIPGMSVGPVARPRYLHGAFHASIAVVAAASRRSRRSWAGSTAGGSIAGSGARDNRRFSASISGNDTNALLTGLRSPATGPGSCQV